MLLKPSTGYLLLVWHAVAKAQQLVNEAELGSWQDQLDIENVESNGLSSYLDAAGSRTGQTLRSNICKRLDNMENLKTVKTADSSATSDSTRSSSITAHPTSTSPTQLFPGYLDPTATGSSILRLNMNVNMASTLSGMTAVSLDSIDFKSSDPNQGSLPTSPTDEPRDKGSATSSASQAIMIFLAETKSGPQNGGLTALLGSVSAAIAPPALYNEPIPTATSSSVAGSDPGPTGSTEASKAPGPSTTAQSTAKANIADSGPNFYSASPAPSVPPASPASQAPPPLVISIPNSILSSVEPETALPDSSRGQQGSYKSPYPVPNGIDNGLEISVLGPGASAIVVGSQTITSGQVATINGIQVSGLSGAVVVGSSTIIIPTSLLPQQTAAPLATVGNQIISSDSSGHVEIDGSMLSVNGSPTTIAGIPVLLDSKTNLIVGSSTIPLTPPKSSPLSESSPPALDSPSSPSLVTLSSASNTGPISSTPTTTTKKHGGASQLGVDYSLLAIAWMLLTSPYWLRILW